MAVLARYTSSAATVARGRRRCRLAYDPKPTAATSRQAMVPVRRPSNGWMPTSSNSIPIPRSAFGARQHTHANGMASTAVAIHPPVLGSSERST
ncbi:hypothetical protein [Mycolicibacterium arabiense]|uniref:hypothetical protein n=1 Tax=Mycolicibacterium arabiense TaxID=1286181 RepID=UPI0013D09DE3|nr:hypothetical protein [Mycolicibacterium arabiense]